MKLDNLDFNHIHINEESSDFNELCCVQMMFHIRKSKGGLKMEITIIVSSLSPFIFCLNEYFQTGQDHRAADSY